MYLKKRKKERKKKKKRKKKERKKKEKMKKKIKEREREREGGGGHVLTKRPRIGHAVPLNTQGVASEYTISVRYLLEFQREYRL